MAGLTPLELATTYASLSSDLVADVLELLRITPNGVYGIEYSAIEALMSKPYHQMTQELSEYSRGAFKPSRIVDGYQEKLPEGWIFSYGFTFRGKKYTTKLIKQANRVDPNFLKCINQALADAKVDGTYYDLGNEEVGEPLFLTKSQKEYLLRKQILVKDF